MVTATAAAIAALESDSESGSRAGSAARRSAEGLKFAQLQLVKARGPDEEWKIRRELLDTAQRSPRRSLLRESETPSRLVRMPHVHAESDGLMRRTRARPESAVSFNPQDQIFPVSPLVSPIRGTRRLHVRSGHAETTKTTLPNDGLRLEGRPEFSYPLSATGGGSLAAFQRRPGMQKPMTPRTRKKRMREARIKAAEEEMRQAEEVYVRYTHISVYTYICTYIHVDIDTYICMYVCMYILTYIRIYMYVCTYTHVYIGR